METERLLLKELHPDNAVFMKELVNTQGWIRFIGERNVATIEDSLKYIQKILNNPNVTYWVIYLKQEGTAIGIISFIKRDYLDHHDIGFALLPQFEKKGYALEAANEVLTQVSMIGNHTRILATVLKENTGSIMLLGKLGLIFEKQIDVDGETLLLYGTDLAAGSQ
jgi:RimJ/RimL family protein N-acetyltransferase